MRGEKFKIFAYEYLSHFLWAMGNEIFTISIGTLIFVSTKFFLIKKSPVKTVFRILSFFIVGIGFYFMGWIFVQEYMVKPAEIYAAIGFAAVATSIYVPFLMYLTREITNIRQLKASFIDFLVSLKPDYKKMMKHAIKPSLFGEAKAEVLDEIKKDSDDFQKKLYEKAEELID